MFQVIRADRACGPVVQQKRLEFTDCGGKVSLEYLSFDSLERTDIVEHLFSTRIGGVSEGIYSSMNLSFTRGDNSAAVLKNYERIARAMKGDVNEMVAAHQTHTTNIRRVTRKDMGKGVTAIRDYEEIDGLITDEKGIILATFYADCVPLYFVDPEHKAIGLAHSGWRGTAAQMGACMVEAMKEQFGSRPESLVAAIGPSICQECYEVSEEVASAFEALLVSMDSERILKEMETCGFYADREGRTGKVLKPGKSPGKYQLDLWLANAIILRNVGIPLSRIEVTDICTCHNPEYLFSHRASNGKRGNLGAFLKLKI